MEMMIVSPRFDVVTCIPNYVQPGVISNIYQERKCATYYSLSGHYSLVF